MVNIVTPSASVSMLLEIEKLVLDEISDFTPPNQGVNLCPAPEGHRDPIAKLLSSSRKKRIGFNSNCDSMIKMMIHCDYVDCDEDEEEDDEYDEEEDENDENSDSRNYHDNGNEIDSNCGDDKRRRLRRRRGEEEREGRGGGGGGGGGEVEEDDDEDKEKEKEKEKGKRKVKGIKVGTGIRNRIRRRRPTGNTTVDTNSALVEMNSQLFLHEDDCCLSPDLDSRSGSPSPVHLISGPNGHRSSSNNNRNSDHGVLHETDRREQLNSPDVNQFLTHEPPDGCEKVNIVKDISKKSIRPLNSLSHVVLAPCPQKPCNPGFVLLPSQSSAFLPLNRPSSDHLTHLDNITNRLNNTDLIGNEYYQSIINNNNNESNN